MLQAENSNGRGNDFKTQLKRKTEKAESVIAAYAPKEEGPQKKLMESMSYSLLAGGKRLRPVIMSEFYRICGGSGKEIEPFMAAIEMIHTYSLIHDDLPAMDNDEYRRGRKTNHIVFGEDIAILAGDALLNYAFEIMTVETCANDDPGKCARAMSVIAKKAGSEGMVGGQVIDVMTEGSKIGMEEILTIHRLKTSALIEASMMAGAIMAGADEKRVSLAERIGRAVGIAFQIQDDILDVTGSEKELGKPVHSDEENNKTTYVTLTGIEDAKRDVNKYSREAVNLLYLFLPESEFLIQLITSLMGRSR